MKKFFLEKNFENGSLCFFAFPAQERRFRTSDLVLRCRGCFGPLGGGGGGGDEVSVVGLVSRGPPGLGLQAERGADGEGPEPVEGCGGLRARGCAGGGAIEGGGVCQYMGMGGKPSTPANETGLRAPTRPASLLTGLRNSMGYVWTQTASHCP